MSAREIQQAVRRLVGGDQGYKPLDGLPVVGAQPGGVSVGHPGGSGAAGFAFTESDYLAREYWAEQTLETSDGIFAWAEEPIKRVVGDSGNLNFAEPIEAPAP